MSRWTAAKPSLEPIMDEAQARWFSAGSSEACMVAEAVCGRCLCDEGWYAEVRCTDPAGVARAWSGQGPGRRNREWALESNVLASRAQ